MKISHYSAKSYNGKRKIKEMDKIQDDIKKEIHASEKEIVKNLL